MADGIAVTAGSGTTILTDDTGAGHAQIVKLAISTDASPTLIPAEATYGLDVDVTRVGAGTAIIGKVYTTDGTTDAEVIPLTGYNAQAVGLVDSSGNQVPLYAPSILTSGTITGNTSAYTALDAYHSGTISFTSAVGASNGTGHILGANLYDTDDIGASFRLWLFNQSVTGTTLNNKMSVSDADLVKAIGYLDFTTYADGDVSKFAMTDGPRLPLPYWCSGSTTLYGILQVLTAPTFATNTPITIALHVARD